MTLQQLTKAQLIEIINKNIDSTRITRILHNMDIQRKMAIYYQAEKLQEEAMEHLREYRVFSEKYEGVPMYHIPHDEFIAARKHYEQYLKLEEQHDKIMTKVKD